MTVCSGLTAQDRTLWYEISFSLKEAEFSIVNHLGIGNEEAALRGKRFKKSFLSGSWESWFELEGSSVGLW